MISITEDWYLKSNQTLLMFVNWAKLALFNLIFLTACFQPKHVLIESASYEEINELNLIHNGQTLNLNKNKALWVASGSMIKLSDSYLKNWLSEIGEIEYKKNSSKDAAVTENNKRSFLTLKSAKNTMNFEFIDLGETVLSIKREGQLSPSANQISKSDFLKITNLPVVIHQSLVFLENDIKALTYKDKNEKEVGFSKEKSFLDFFSKLKYVDTCYLGDVDNGALNSCLINIRRNSNILGEFLINQKYRFSLGRENHNSNKVNIYIQGERIIRRFEGLKWFELEQFLKENGADPL